MQAKEIYKQILYIESNSGVREQVEIELEGGLSVQVTSFTTAQEAVDYMEKRSKGSSDQSIELIIAALNRDDNQGGDHLYRYIKKFKPNIPFLFHSEKPLEDCTGFESFYEDNSANHWVAKPDTDSIVPVASDMLHLKEADNKNSEYCKVAINSFLKSNSAASDIYIRLSQNKFIKIINAQDEYVEEMVAKYRKRGVKYFYVKQKSFISFCRNYKDTLRKQLKQKNMTNEQQVDASLNGISFVHEEILNLGLSPSSVETLDTVVDSNIKFMRKSPMMSLLLENMVKNKNYQYEHSLMISYISMAISMKMQWNTLQTLEKLSLAALMHDVVIENKDISKDHDLYPDNIQNSRWRTLELIKNHPESVAKIIDEMSDIPPDVSNIVLTHHENVEGTGYPRELKANQISPLNCVFIMTEEVTSEVFRHKGEPIDKLALVNRMETRYDKGNFRTVVPALKEVILK